VKIVVTSTEPGLDAQVDPRFGRCQFFVFVETDDLSFEAVENPNIAVGGGAGIQSAQAIAEKGAAVVLTGNCGPNAYQTLAAAGVQVIVGVSGSVRQVVEQFKSGAFSAADQPNVQSHFGMGTGPGMGRGMGQGMGQGMGRGMGRGMGQGMGRGMGMGMSPAPPMTPPAQMTTEQEIEMLKRQIDQINGRIKELEG
jgi:predicted Fe-Mo cluster-binding NifX family protein